MDERRTVTMRVCLKPTIHAAVAARAYRERRPVATMLALMIEDAVLCQARMFADADEFAATAEREKEG